jgi:hypothetical protein
MSDDESEGPESEFKTQVKQRTSKLGEDMKLAVKNPADKKLFQKCVANIAYITKQLIPKSLTKAGLASKQNKWELDFSKNRGWDNGSIVLVAHATTEKRRLVIMNTRGTALSVPDEFKVDMIAISLSRSTGNMFVMKLKHLNVLSTRKTWWAMNKDVLALNLKANYDEATHTFSIKDADQPVLKDIYQKHVYGMEKTPKSVARNPAHTGLEQFALHVYPTEIWRKTCLAERASKHSNNRGTQKTLSYKINEGPNLTMKKRRLRNRDRELSKKARKNVEFQGKIIWYSLAGHRLTVQEIQSEKEDPSSFLSCLDTVEKTITQDADTFVSSLSSSRVQKLTSL